MTEHRTVEREVIINGGAYRVGKLSAKTQFHIARRLAPVLLAFLQKQGSGSPEELKKIDPFELLSGPVVQALADLKDEDCDFVLDNCLAVCQRQRDGGWSFIVLKGVYMHQDLDLPTLLELTAATIQHNMESFFPTARPASNPPV